MKSNLSLFLIGALVGAALALGARAVIESSEGGHSMHRDHGGRAEKPAEKPAEKSAPKRTGLLIDLGNEICPIMGNKVNGETWSEWNGLRVGHCCPPCIEDFLAEPEKTLDEKGIEWRAAAAAVAAIKAASGHERHRLLAETGKTWKIVREK
jgi:hypothetical protein